MCALCEQTSQTRGPLIIAASRLNLHRRALQYTENSIYRFVGRISVAPLSRIVARSNRNSSLRARRRPGEYSISYRQSINARICGCEVKLQNKSRLKRKKKKRIIGIFCPKLV